jgi:hypothetical protein
MCKRCYEEPCECAKKCKRDECVALNKIQPRNIYTLNTPTNKRRCDLCNNAINETYLSENFYSVKTEDYEETFDICLDCYQKSDDVRNMVETKCMRLIDVNDKSNYYFSHTGFNSMLYWFPIVSDTQGCRVFMNLYPDDINYGKLCLQSCDDHGRFGYFIIQDETYNLQRVLERLKEICDKGTVEYRVLEKVEDGIYGEKVTINKKGYTLTTREIIKEPKYEYVTKTYELSSPIHILMEELKMPVYYG